MSGPSLALSNLRAVVILIVLAFHSMLAYLDALPPKAYAFDAPPHQWQAFPIIDSQRWFGFDLFCAWQDVCLMSMMFFLSGLFVWSSLQRKGIWKFLGDRVNRIGLPAALIVLLLIPVSYYPAYLVTAADPSVAAYWRHWVALGFWPSGPQWFLWELLAMNLFTLVLCRLAPQWGDRLGALTASARTQPIRFFIGLALASTIAYVPLALIFGPWEWSNFLLFGFQLSRPLHYAVYFFAGVAVGAYGLERGLVATDGMLGRHWQRWLLAAVVGFGLWAVPTGLTLDYGNAAPFMLQFAAYVGFALACASGCLCLVAISVRFGRVQSHALNSLSANAYGMYLLHYVFIVWLQYALLGVPLVAVLKAAIVFGGTLLASWAITAALAGIPLGSRVIGAKQ